AFLTSRLRGCGEALKSSCDVRVAGCPCEFRRQGASQWDEKLAGPERLCRYTGLQDASRETNQLAFDPTLAFQRHGRSIQKYVDDAVQVVKSDGGADDGRCFGAAERRRGQQRGIGRKRGRCPFGGGLHPRIRHGFPAPHRARQFRFAEAVQHRSMDVVTVGARVEPRHHGGHHFPQRTSRTSGGEAFPRGAPDTGHQFRIRNVHGERRPDEEIGIHLIQHRARQGRSPRVIVAREVANLEGRGFFKKDPVKEPHVSYCRWAGRLPAGLYCDAGKLPPCAPDVRGYCCCCCCCWDCSISSSGRGGGAAEVSCSSSAPSSSSAGRTRTSTERLCPAWPL